MSVVTTKDGQTFQFPDEFTPEQIKAALDRHYARTAAPSATATADPFASDALRRRALEMLPTAGGLVGGLGGGAVAGPAGAIGGATAGGATGEAIREYALGKPLSPSSIAMQGAGQGAWELGGGLMAKGAGMAARPLIKGAVRASDRLLREFPQVYETILKKGLPVSKAGVEKANILGAASSEALSDNLRAATASGTRFRTFAVTAPVRKLLRKRALSDANRAQIQAQLDAFVKQYGKEIDPILLKEIKQEHQSIAKSVYSAATEAGGGISPSNQKRFAAALAHGAKTELERIPGVAAQEAETRSLIGARRAVGRAERRPPPPFRVLEPGTYPVLSLLAHPHVQSKLAIALAHPGFQAALRQGPRAGAALLAQLMETDQPEETQVSP